MQSTLHLCPAQPLYSETHNRMELQDLLRPFRSNLLPIEDPYPVETRCLSATSMQHTRCREARLVQLAPHQFAASVLVWTPAPSELVPILLSAHDSLVHGGQPQHTAAFSRPIVDRDYLLMLAEVEERCLRPVVKPDCIVWWGTLELQPQVAFPVRPGFSFTVTIQHFQEDSCDDEPIVQPPDMEISHDEQELPLTTSPDADVTWLMQASLTELPTADEPLVDISVTPPTALALHGLGGFPCNYADCFLEAQPF